MRQRTPRSTNLCAHGLLAIGARGCHVVEDPVAWTVLEAPQRREHSRGTVPEAGGGTEIAARELVDSTRALVAIPDHVHLTLGNQTTIAEINMAIIPRGNRVTVRLALLLPWQQKRKYLHALP